MNVHVKSYIDGQLLIHILNSKNNAHWDIRAGTPGERETARESKSLYLCLVIIEIEGERGIRNI